MSDAFGTTNLLLGIMAVVSVLELVAIIAIAAAAFRAYRTVMGLVGQIETRHVAPAIARVNAILDDVKFVTATVRTETERIDHAVHATVARMEDAADRLRSNVRVKTSTVVGVVRGLRGAVEGVLRRRAV